MADDIDRSVATQEAALDQTLAAARAAASAIPAGVPGMCEACCDDSPRLVLTGGLKLCAPCRDKRVSRR